MAYRLQHTGNRFFRIQRQGRMRSKGVHDVQNERFSEVFWCTAQPVCGVALHAIQIFRPVERDTLPAVEPLES